MKKNYFLIGFLFFCCFFSVQSLTLSSVSANPTTVQQYGNTTISSVAYQDVNTIFNTIGATTTYFPANLFDDGSWFFLFTAKKTENLFSVSYKGSATTGVIGDVRAVLVDYNFGSINNPSNTAIEYSQNTFHINGTYNSIADFNFSGETVLQKDKNYWVGFLITRVSGTDFRIDARDTSPPETYLRSTYCNVGSCSNFSDANINLNLIFPPSYGYYGVNVRTKSPSPIKLWCGNLTGNYSVCTSQNYVTKNPTCDFTVTLPPPSQTIYCQTFSQDGNFSVEKTTTITITAPTQSFLTFTPIKNISSYSFGTVDIVPTEKESDIIYRVDSNSVNTQTVEYSIKNSLKGGKQYFVYVADQLEYDNNEWVFDDSLTYSSPADSKPIQKIWYSDEESYFHSFQDLILPLETKYYKLTYKSPAFYWSQQNSDWFKQVTPTDLSDNGITWDSFTLSSYVNLFNYPQKELSQLISTSDVSYEFQFTGYTADLNANVGVYLLDTNNDLTLLETVNLTTTKTRFSVSLDPTKFSQKILLKTTQVYPVTIYLVDYAVVPRGYFTSPLKLLQTDGSELPTVVEYPNYYQYIEETENFLARTTIYDREGDLNQLVITVFFDANSDSNASKKFYVDLNLSGTNTLQQSFEDILDLSDNADYVIVKFTLYDKTGLIVAEQSKTTRFLQWPHFPNELKFFFADNALIVGDNPNGTVSLETTKPNNILGLEFYIYNDTNSPATPNYYTQIFTPQDFQCIGGDCSFNYSIPEFAFSKDSNKWFITAQVLLRTRNRTVPALTGNAVPYVYTVTKTINFFALKKARVVQTFERVDRKYKNSEQIALTVQLQNVLNDDVRKDLRVWLEMFDCANQATGACVGVPATYVYNPVSSIYDQSTGQNYFFFKNLFLTTPDSNLLTDGNYYRVVAYVSDATGKYQDASTLQIFLGDKSDSSVITNTTNSGDEKRLLIDNSIVLSPPTFEFLGCLRLDTNLVFDSPRKPVITCYALYSIKNSFPNQFNFRLSNNNSNTDETKDIYKQYIDFTVPYDVLSVNDISFLQKALNANYHTSCTNIFCILGLYSNSIGSFLGNAFGENLWNWSTDADFNNFMVYNSASDVNFSHFFDPTYVSGVLVVQVSNTNFINKKDYEASIPELKQVNPKYFVRYMRDNGESLPETTTNIKVYSSSLEPFMDFEEPNFLVINEAEKPKAQKNVSDSNNIDLLDLSIPTVLQVNVGGTMVYDNALSSHYLYVPLTFKTIITSQTPFWDNLIGAIPEIINDPAGFAVKNIVPIVIIILVAFAFVVIYREIKGNK